MTESLVDTDILSFYFKDDPNVVERFNEYLREFDLINISLITYYEVIAGLKFKKAERQIREFEEFIKNNAIIHISEESAKISAEIYAQLRQSDPSDLILTLIREELKSRKFFSGLQQLGLDYCFYPPHLDKLILTIIGLDEDSDEVYDFYFRLVEKHGRKIREDRESITKRARKVYRKLVAERERRRFVIEV